MSKDLVIGRRRFNLEALKGISKTAFLKSVGNETEWEKIEPFVKEKTKKGGK